MSDSRYWNPGMRRRWSALALLACVGGARAQYQGHSVSKVKAGPVLRSIAVLEWTGEPGKPSASRLVPVSVFHDGVYEDGGLYLARPEPLSLGHGTEYLLQDAGLSRGVFDIVNAEQTNGDWFGYGPWKPVPPPTPVHVLKESSVAPVVIDGGDDRRPHFRKAPPESGPGAGPPGQSTPPADPERPTLSKRRESAPDASSPANATANASTAAAMGGAESATPGGDPDRPRLTRSKEHPQEAVHLAGMPTGLEQMVAVSDAAERAPHSFAYKWAEPGDAAKMQAQLTTLALQAITKASAARAGAAKAGEATPAAARSTASHAAVHSSGTAARRSTTGAAAAARRNAAAMAAAASALTDVQFHAYELTYSGGATLVLTGRTAGDEAKARYVMLIAQPDIYGTPQVLFTQVTNGDDQDATPRLRLVDAVDAAGDNRGDLLMELRGATTRQFAIYRVASGRVDQLIATGPMPIGNGAAE